MIIGICDDQKYMVEELKQHIINYFGARDYDYMIFEYSNGKEVVDSEIVHDILFLDIEMPEMDGMEAAKILKSKRDSNRTALVFLTGHAEAMRYAFRVKAFRFLLKDDYENDLIECMDAFRQELLLDVKYEVDVIDEHSRKVGTTTVNQKDIICLTSHQHGADIWHVDGCYRSRKCLKEWATILPEELFVRCDKENIVNLRHIQYIKDKEIFLEGGLKCKISRRKEETLKKQFFTQL